MTETGKQLTTWESMYAAKEKALMIMGDFNETLTRDREADELVHRTARGALLMQWFQTLGLSAPPQQTNTPSYYPYNQSHRLRRLDYVLVRRVTSTEGGGVHPARQVAASDHAEKHHAPETWTKGAQAADPEGNPRGERSKRGPATGHPTTSK